MELAIDVLTFVLQLMGGIYILSRNPSNKQVKLIAVLCLMITFWALNDIFFNIIPPDAPRLATNSARILWCAIFMLPAIYYDLTLEFIENNNFKLKNLTYVFYLCGVILCLLNQFMPIKLEYQNYKFVSAQSPIFKINTVYVVVASLLAAYTFFRSYFYASSPEVRSRLSPFLYASLIGFALPGICNGISVIFNYNFPVPAGFIGFLVLPFIMARAIKKQGSLDILEIRQSQRLFSLLKAFILGIYLVFIYYIESLLKQFYPESNLIVESLIIFILVLVFLPMKNLADTFLSWLVIAGSNIDLTKKLQQGRQKIERAQTKGELVEAIKEALDRLEVLRFVIVRNRNVTGSFVVEGLKGMDQNALPNFGMDYEDPIVSKLMTEPKPFVFLQEIQFASLAGPYFKQLNEFRKLGLECIIPIVHEKVVLAFVFIGRKESGDIISMDEIEIIQNELFHYAGVKIFALNERGEREAREKRELTEHVAQGLIHGIKGALSGITQLLNEFAKGGEAPLARRSLDALQREAKFCVEQIRKALSISKEENFASVALNDVLKAVSDSFSDKEMQIILELSQSLPALQGVRDRLEDAFENILRNAVQASKPGGRVWVRSTPLNKEDGATSVVATIEDEGEGIPEENIENIFDPTFSTRHKTGSGIGLSYVKLIIEHHGGILRVKSKPGKGTAVQVFFPVQPI